MRVVLGADHAGFHLKTQIAGWLQSAGHPVQDVGAYNLDPQDDYPDYAYAVAERVVSGQADRGILVCGSGVGACVVANKLPGVRAATCHDTYSARQGVEHDDMNVLSLGARVIGSELAREVVQAFLNATFTGEERHRRRLNKLLDIERRTLGGSKAAAKDGS